MTQGTSRRPSALAVVLLAFSIVLVVGAVFSPYISALAAGILVAVVAIFRRKIGPWWTAVLVVATIAFVLAVSMVALSIDVSGGAVPGHEGHESETPATPIGQ